MISGMPSIKLVKSGKVWKPRNSRSSGIFSIYGNQALFHTTEPITLTRVHHISILTDPVEITSLSGNDFPNKFYLAMFPLKLPLPDKFSRQTV